MITEISIINTIGLMLFMYFMGLGTGWYGHKNRQLKEEKEQ